MLWASNMGVGTIWFEARCCTLNSMAIWANVDLSQPHPPNARHIILVPPSSQCCCWCDSAASQLRQPISWKISCFCCRLEQLLGLMWSLECQCWWNGQGLCSQGSWGPWQPMLVLARGLWDCTHTVSVEMCCCLWYTVSRWQAVWLYCWLMCLCSCCGYRLLWWECGFTASVIFVSPEDFYSPAEIYSACYLLLL